MTNTDNSADILADTKRIKALNGEIEAMETEASLLLSIAGALTRIDAFLDEIGDLPGKPKGRIAQLKRRYERLVEIEVLLSDALDARARATEIGVEVEFLDHRIREESPR